MDANTTADTLTTALLMDDAVRRLKEAGIEAYVRQSKRDVPHIVGYFPNVRERFSLCWFWSTKKWRVYHPWPGGNQSKHTLESLPAVIRLLRAHGTTTETSDKENTNGK